MEAIEFFTVSLENPVGITVGSGQTLVTINQDDSDGKKTSHVQQKYLHLLSFVNYLF